ncbi:hypothetical protein JW906_04320 [bacterium]|nr:hypothetical protein [bacterium]
MLLIFWLVGGAVLALLLLLVLRVRVRFRLELQGKPARYEIRAGILNDALGLTWSGQGSSQAVIFSFGPVGLPFRKRKIQTASGGAKPASGQGLSRFIRRWESAAGFFMKAASRISWENVNVRCRLGFPDPAWTGMTCGMVSCLGTLPGKASLDLTPDFEQPGLSGMISAAVSFVPAVMLGEYLQHRLRDGAD